MGELLEEMALTGELELCVGEGSAQGKPFEKELTTIDINIYGGKQLNGPQLVGSNSRNLLKSTRGKGGIANLAFSPDLLI